MKALIVGMGFGRVLYGNIYNRWGWDITYVDPYIEDADYKLLEDIPRTDRFDIAHICTPNFTHFELAFKAAKFCKAVLVEKPGVGTSQAWQLLLDSSPNTRIMMTKNNQHRWEIKELAERAKEASNISINWANENRIPKPGSWFTTKEKAFGGVSRDLMPHMLSIYQMLNPDWRKTERTSAVAAQIWNLDKLDSSDYGEVDKTGTYNVDDMCSMGFDGKYTCYANWRTTLPDDIAIHMSTGFTFELGLCPEEAYEQMILRVRERMHDNSFWNEQKEMDLWIHQQLETL